MSRSWIFLGVTLAFLVALVAIVAAVYRRGRAEGLERPKHRMLDDD